MRPFGMPTLCRLPTDLWPLTPGPNVLARITEGSQTFRAAALSTVASLSELAVNFGLFFRRAVQFEFGVVFEYT